MRILWVIIDLVSTALMFLLLFFTKVLLVNLDTLLIYFVTAVLSFILMLAAIAIRKAIKIDLRKIRFLFLLLIFFFIVAIIRLIFEKEVKGINWAFVLIIMNAAIPIAIDLSCLSKSIHKGV